MFHQYIAGLHGAACSSGGSDHPVDSAGKVSESQSKMQQVHIAHKSFQCTTCYTIHSLPLILVRVAGG